MITCHVANLDFDRTLLLSFSTGIKKFLEFIKYIRPNLNNNYIAFVNNQY